MFRSVVPPPPPEMILSILMPSSAKKPFSDATAQGNVAVTRPYWLTTSSAVQDRDVCLDARSACPVQNCSAADQEVHYAPDRSRARRLAVASGSTSNASETTTPY